MTPEREKQIRDQYQERRWQPTIVRELLAEIEGLRDQNALLLTKIDELRSDWHRSANKWQLKFTKLEIELQK